MGVGGGGGRRGGGMGLWWKEEDGRREVKGEERGALQRWGRGEGRREEAEEEEGRRENPLVPFNPLKKRENGGYGKRVEIGGGRVI